MKLKSLCGVLIIACITLLTVSCNDTLDPIGFTIQPDKDRLNISVDTMELRARTVIVDSIYSKVRNPVLGEYIDPVFGSIKSEYVGEFYYPEVTTFHDGASIDSVRVQLSYTTMMGDSLSPMELSVYEITKSLKEMKPYSHIDPIGFANMSAPLGRQSFTGKNSTFRTETTQSGTSVKVYEINVKMPLSIGEKILAEYKKEGHGKLATPDDFREFFPGLYFTTTFGKSTILNISLTSMLLHYKYEDKGGSSTQQDTIRTSAIRLNINPIVTQINHIQNKNPQLVAENNDYTFIKSPAGVNTEITFPISEMNEKLNSKALNLANLVVYAMPEQDDNSQVKLSPPNHLLLIHKDSLNGYFENRRLNDNISSFVSAKFDATSYSYRFGNISSMLNYYIEKDATLDFLSFYLVPVDVVFIIDSQGNVTTTPNSISNRMWPAAVRLDKRKDNLKLDMIFSNF